jgi:hypothetical protein
MEMALVDQHYFVIDMCEGSLKGALITRVFSDHLLNFIDAFLLGNFERKKPLFLNNPSPICSSINSYSSDTY